jgi:hypothetical protein
MSDLHRRQVLRGLLNGTAVAVALPLLDCFLNDNGTALASGAPMPVRFGTWFWGLGMQDKVFVPKKTGHNYDLPEEITSFAPIQNDMNLITNLNVYRDTSSSFCHVTGWVIMHSGTAPVSAEDRPDMTFHVAIANHIGATTRFPSISATASGDARASVSYENSTTPTAFEASPLNFYAQLFGPDFPDPNASTFTPNPRVMLRRSVLSGVQDHTQKLMKKVGAADRARLEQYFTGVRDLEQQLDQQLTKPEPIAACRPPKEPAAETKLGTESSLVSKRHRLLTDLMVMAITCDQSRVFNMMYSPGFANTIKAGYEKPHHTTTHEERIDEVTGLQPTVSWFTRRAFEEWLYFVQAFKKVKEGDGTLLDRLFIVATTDHGYARVHSLDRMPAFTAGRGGGKVKTGLHVDGAKRQGTMLGLTAMRLMGLEKANWGSGSNATSAEFSEILA